MEPVAKGPVETGLDGGVSPVKDSRAGGLKTVGKSAKIERKIQSQTNGAG